MNFNEKLEQYAKISIEVGINLIPGQKLHISSPIECVELTRALSKVAFKKGAKDVIIDWIDEKSSLIRYELASDETFLEYPKYLVEQDNTLIDENCAFIGISSRDPELLKNVDPKRVATWNKTVRTASKYRQEKLMKNSNQWLVISAPIEAISKKIFPNAKTTEEAISLHWDAIFNAVRIDGNDPVENWNKHISVLKERMKFLNDNKFSKLILKNSEGTTNLEVELATDHYWVGGGDYTMAKHYFVANMPTEEIYSMPKKTGVNGVVKSTKPFNYNGNTIENFTLTFKEGKIVDFNAEVGQEILELLLNTDEGSRYIGEIALVPYDSPISNSGLTFYNTLFDENASCHLAFGKAYPTNIINGANMTHDELVERGCNMSLIHEDFMIGSSDLDIVGIKANGEEVQVFKDGNFVI